MLKSLFTIFTLLALQAGAVMPALHAIVPATAAAVSDPANQSVDSHASTNWAGYEAQDGLYSGIGASWSVSSVDAAQSASLATDATWVGIGGVKSTDLIQAGTQALVEDGTVTYSAWYETLPAYQQKIPLAVHAGDSVTVSLIETAPGLWQLSFTNLTTGKNYSRQISYNSSKSSAEWIEERPIAQIGRGFSLIPLDQFGSVTFTAPYVIDNGARVGLSSVGATSLMMVGGGEVLASAGSIDSSGSFSVSRTAESTTGLAAAPIQRTITQNIPTGHNTRHGRGSYGGGNYIIYITFGNGESQLIRLLRG